MTKVLVLYYSSYGHIETMAMAVAEGVRSAGAEVDVKRVPELVPAEVAKASHFKLDQAAPIAVVDDLANYDAIIFGTPTRYGNMAAQMKNFIDVGLPYSFAGQFGHEAVKGASPYGASTIAGPDGSRQPTDIELEAARYQGAHVAKIAAKLSA